MSVDSTKEEMNKYFEKLPSRGQRVVLTQLIDPYDPVTHDVVMTFMFADPDHGNLLWFTDEGRPVAIPRDAGKVYTGMGGTLSLQGLPTLFGFGLGNACLGWRPYRGLK